MFPTVEVRWFYSGTILPQVLEWFRERQGQPEEPAYRVDYYLHFPDGDSLGIKLREGKLEIKRRHRQYGVVEFHERAAGLVEYWRKWSFELMQASVRFGDGMAPDSSWIGVSKQRWLCRYRITVDGTIVPMGASGYPEQGCHLELTSIKAKGREGWTWGFEAFGEETALRENLVLVATQIFAALDPPIVLDVGHSYSYPAWLAGLS